MLETTVLVAGGGPVGLALAGDLGWRGVSCLLAERGDGGIHQPKMDLVGIRTMEFCRRWGIAEWVESSPYPRDYPQDNVYVTALAGWELGREAVPALDEAPPPPQSPQRRERCPQDMFDPILRRFAASMASVRLRYGTELVRYAEDNDGVRAWLRTASGREEMVRADYLVGCDGASSTVRRSAGIAMRGRAALTYTTNVIFRAPDLPRMHDKGLAYRFILVGKEGTWATIVAINGRDRWRMSIIGDDTPRIRDEASIRAAIGRAVGAELDYEIESVVPWARGELVADAYGSAGGRVFIAGDAAHVMSPTGGFGMNTGIGDAVDLSWKLAARVAGWGGAYLTASYDAERRPVAVRNVAEASENLRRLLSPRHEIRPPAAFLDDTPAGAVARARLGAEFGRRMKHEWHTLGMHLGYRYDDSPVIVGDGSPEPPDERLTYTQTARPGARAPHVRLAGGGSTLDLFGRYPILLRLGSSPRPADGLRRAAAAAGMPLEVVDLDDPAVLEAYGGCLILVRPDGHVAWRSAAEPTDAAAIIDIIRGAHAPAALEVPA